MSLPSIAIAPSLEKKSSLKTFKIKPQSQMSSIDATTSTKEYDYLKSDRKASLTP